MWWPHSCAYIKIWKTGGTEKVWGSAQSSPVEPSRYQVSAGLPLEPSHKILAFRLRSPDLAGLLAGCLPLILALSPEKPRALSTICTAMFISAKVRRPRLAHHPVHPSHPTGQTVARRQPHVSPAAIPKTENLLGDQGRRWRLANGPGRRYFWRR